MVKGDGEPFLIVSEAPGARYEGPLRREVAYELGQHHVFAYVFAGFPDHPGVLRFVPGNALLTRFFIGLDRLICKVPGLAMLGFHVVVVARPRP